jgi:hypothetical protein
MYILKFYKTVYCLLLLLTYQLGTPAFLKK